MDEIIACFCNSCSEELGQFRNAWNIIGNNYYTPVYPILTYKDGFAGRGDVRPSKLGSHETCFLQDLVCKSCRVYLGIRCDSAPQSHILEKNQYLLRLSEITVLVAGTNQKAQILVKNSFILEAAAGSAAKRSKSKAQSVGPSRSKSMSVQPSSFNVRATMPPPPRPASKLNGTAPALVALPSTFEVWSEKELKDQRKDIDRISTAVDRIERTMDGIKEFMEEVRGQRASDQEREETPRSEAAKSMKTDMNNLHRRLEAFEKKNSDMLASVASSLNNEFNTEMGRLAGNVEAIGREGVDAVDLLKKELSAMHEKVMDLEASATNGRLGAFNTHHAMQTSEAALQQRSSSLSQRTEMIPMQRALELAAMNDGSGLASGAPSYEMPNTKDRRSRLRNGNDKSEISRPSKIFQHIPISHALELAGMIDGTDSASDFPPYATDVFRKRDNTSPVLGTRKFARTNNEAVSQLKTSKRAEHIQMASMVESTKRQEIFPGQETLGILGEANASKQDSATLQPGNPVVRVEISPMKPDLGFPANLISPDSTDYSEVESIPAISPVAKRKRPEPSDIFPQMEEDQDFSQSNAYQRKKRRVSDRGPGNGAADSQAPPGFTVNGQRQSPPEPGIIEIKDSSPMISIEDFSSSCQPTIPIENREPSDPIATPEQIQNPFKCGVCKRRFVKSQGLKIHKNHNTACKADSSNDEVPSDFICSGCEQSFTSLLYFNRHKCPPVLINNLTDIAAAARMNHARNKDEQDVRREKLAAREQLVKETLEREILKEQSS